MIADWRRAFRKSAWQDNATAVNIQRIYRLSFIAVPIHVAHIILFWLALSPGDSDATVQWKQAIMLLHASMSLVAIGTGAAAWKLKKGNGVQKTQAIVLQQLLIFSWLLFGILVAWADLLVSASITPFLMACLGVAVVFLIPPLLSVLQYMTAFLLFQLMLTWTSHSADILLSLRVNALTLLGISLGVSVFLWRMHEERMRQQEKIENQNRFLEQVNEELAWTASHDSLTGLINRPTFIQKADEWLNQGILSGLIVMDIDLFKQVNDQHGHPAGDAILKSVADILRQSVGMEGITGRLGGEEFVILIPDSDEHASSQTAERLRQTIEEYVFLNDIRITASFGVAEMNGTFAASYHAADEALYRAKKSGRNRVEAGQPQTDSAFV